jgi:zinc protease
MRPAVRLPLLALAFVLVTAAVAAAAPRPSAPPGPAPLADARLVTLGNGLQLLLAPDTAATAVDVAVWSRAGAAREPAGRLGMARLFERLMFAGSANHGPQEHQRLVAAAGGAAGAFSTADFACYHQTVPPGALDLALELEADRIAALRLSPPVVADAARAVADEARRQAETQPWAPALRAFYELAWGAHPYARLAQGPAADLARIGVEEAEAWHAAAFAPHELLVTIAGRFDADEALRLAKRRLEPLRRRPGLPAAAPVPPQKETRRAWRRLDVPLDLLVAGWKTPGRGAPETAALAVLARVLSGAASAPQRALLADSVGCLSVQAAFDGRRDGGLLYAMAVVRPGADSARVEATLLAQLERLAREPVSEAELDRARRQEEVATLLGWQTPRGVADALGQARLVDGDGRAAALRLEQVRRLTAADVQRAAAVLVPAGRSLLWVSTTRPAAPAGVGRARPGLSSSRGGR